MADEADLAQKFIPEVNTAEISARFLKPSLTHCEECDEEIPEKRRSLGGVTHCIYCQSFLEEGSKRH